MLKIICYSNNYNFLQYTTFAINVIFGHTFTWSINPRLVLTQHEFKCLQWSLTKFILQLLNIKRVQKISYTSKPMAPPLIIMQQWICVGGFWICFQVCWNQQMMHMSSINQILSFSSKWEIILRILRIGQVLLYLFGTHNIL